ncbi:LINGO1 [Branchiostoma lanceolatum]|uniref:LINGO1 protein n=1 Tax=Branchiostoma lanceolatum TaxID=7740 RepID=A0A8J9ZVB7_BRALA|nr:LINGO1 [Branchiostoma lanceolatum]
MTPTMRLPCVLIVIMSVAVCMFLGSSACPMYCTCDNVEKYEIAVYCRGPKISAIPRDIPKNTTLLEISFTEVAVLRMGDFVDMPKLTQLNVWSNFKLSAVEFGTFDNLPTITDLRLSNNSFTKLPTGLFDSLKNLTTFDGRNNKLEMIQHGLFTDHPSLQIIRVDSGNIAVLEEGAFGGLTNLTSVYVGSNRLTSLTSSAFKGSAQLKSLLSTLYLSNITCLKGTLNSNALRGLNALKEVWLSFNELSTLPTTTFQSTTYITTIWLQNNSLVELSHGLLHGLTDLNQLDLSYNRLSHLNPDTFLGLDKLRILLLTGNNFTNMAHVSPALALLPSQVALNLKENPFVHLDRVSFPMPMNHANVLSMSRSHIRVIEEGTFLDVTFSNLTRLELDQTDFLHFLPGNMLEGLDNLTAMIAYDDPFHCDCQLKAFVTWLRERVNPPYVSATCASPPSLKCKDLTDVPLASLTCDCQQVEAPSIDTSGSDNSTREGQTAMLNCKISGCPEAEFFWTTPTGAMLAVESGFPRMEVLGSGTLVVTEAREEDTGVYTCTAVNYRGKTSKEVALHVDNKQ